MVRAVATWSSKVAPQQLSNAHDHDLTSNDDDDDCLLTSKKRCAWGLIALAVVCAIAAAGAPYPFCVESCPLSPLPPPSRGAPPPPPAFFVCFFFEREIEATRFTRVSGSTK